MRTHTRMRTCVFQIVPNCSNIPNFVRSTSAVERDCMSVRALTSTSSICEAKARCQQISNDISKVFESWISPIMFCSKVMARKLLFLLCWHGRPYDDKGSSLTYWMGQPSSVDTGSLY